MSYPPPNNGPYPPQYLQHSQPSPRQHPQQQFLYNNINPAQSPQSPYQYGRPVVYPQVIPNFNSYAQAFNSQHHAQQPQPVIPPQPQPQYVNPVDLFQQASVAPAIPSQFTTFGSPQYAGQPAIPVANNNPDRSPALPTVSGSTQPSFYPAPSASPGINNSAYSQYPQVAPKPQPPPMQTKPAPSPVPAPTPVPAPVASPNPVSTTASATMPSVPSSTPTVAPAPASRSMTSTPTAPTSTPRPVPQVLIPAPSPEVQQKLKQQAQQATKKQGQGQRQGSLQSARKQGKPSVDYQVLLLSLADEYLNAAHSHGTTVASSRQEMDVEEYYKLLATGLGCLEAVLKNWRLQPRMEALVRLRYARVLFEETDNDLEAETALSKGIDLCERNRMLDLKYSMQHLLARMLHKTNPRASLKAVDGMIQDVEAYRHSAWEYAFRFLRVSLSLSLSSPTHQDSVSALHHLHKISQMANRNGDKAVSAMSAVIEALAHLQLGSNFDSIEQAQRAIATARSHQLNDELRHIPQLITLVQMVDICCSLLEYDVNQSAQKLRVLQEIMDERLNYPNWRVDGSFSVPLNGKSAGPSSIDTGDILQVQNGTLLLSFSWLPQHDLYALCYFLSSVTLSARNSHDGRKAEKFLQEGRRMLNSSFETPENVAESMVNANKRIEWRRTLCCNIILQQVFLACARTDWDFARQNLKELRQIAQELGENLSDDVRCLMEYTAGTIAQATGDLKAAQNIFQSPLLSLSPSASKATRNDPRRDIAILAAINTVLILRDPIHPSHSLLPGILSTIESFSKTSPNKYIQAAYYLVSATVQTESTIQTKQFLQQALQSATAISNSQITCMTLTFMSWKYFRGVIGEQAEKSARAGRAMAKKANDRLWVSVTDEMLAETLERQGKGEEAMGVRDEGMRVTMGLPGPLRRNV